MGKKTKKGLSRQKSQTKPMPPQPEPPRGRNKIIALLAPTGWFWATVSLLLAFVGAYYLLKPKIMVALEDMLESHNAFTARFEIINDGALSIYNVKNFSVWKDLDSSSAAEIEFADTNSWPELKSGSKTTFHFDEFQIGGLRPIADAPNYHIQIGIIYKPALWYRFVTNTFGFTASKHMDGTYFITSYGDGDYYDHIINK